jgi:hypothetical protein
VANSEIWQPADSDPKMRVRFMGVLWLELESARRAGYFQLSGFLRRGVRLRYAEPGQLLITKTFRAHSVGFAECRAEFLASEWFREHVAELCGAPEEDLSARHRRN